MTMLFTWAQRLERISTAMDAVHRYDERLDEHVKSDTCTSSLPRNTWDIEAEDCLVCKDLMQRIEERESEIPRWVTWLAVIVAVFHPIETVRAWRSSRDERRAGVVDDVRRGSVGGDPSA